MYWIFISITKSATCVALKILSRTRTNNFRIEPLTLRIYLEKVQWSPRPAIALPKSACEVAKLKEPLVMKTTLLLLATFVLALASDQDVKVTLEDGPARFRGRVEVTVGDNAPRQVCTSDFSSDDTDKLCQAAGFQDSVASITNYGTKGGLEFIKVTCTTSGCEYENEPNNYICPDQVLGLDCSPRVGVTGSIGLEAGIIAGILVCIVAVVAVALGLGVCLYRNDLIPCLQNAAVA